MAALSESSMGLGFLGTSDVLQALSEAVYALGRQFSDRVHECFDQAATAA